MTALTQLEWLSIGINPITDLPPSFAKLARLKYLSLAWCHLEHVPGSLLALPSLRSLSLAWNPITRLPPALGRLPLEELDLHDTRLTDPAPEIVEAGTEAVLAYLRYADMTNEPD